MSNLLWRQHAVIKKRTSQKCLLNVKCKSLQKIILHFVLRPCGCRLDCMHVHVCTTSVMDACIVHSESSSKVCTCTCICKLNLYWIHVLYTQTLCGVYMSMHSVHTLSLMRTCICKLCLVVDTCMCK